MKCLILSSFLSIFVLSGCLSNNSNNGNDVLNDTLESSFQNIENSLSKRRTSLLFSNGDSADSCASYFLLSSKYNINESIYNQQVKSEYLMCDALQILAQSSGIKNSRLDKINFGDQLASNLDLRTFPSSLRRALTDTSHTLKSIFPEQFKSLNNTLEVDTEDWRFSVEVVALAKINDNSFPDWIVWFSDESKSGNYRGYSTLIIYDPEPHKRFNATVYPEVCSAMC